MALTQQQKAQPLPGEKSSFPVLVLLVGWLIPGGGHFLLGKWVRGLLLFAAILIMFLAGISYQGEIYAPNTGDILDILGFAGQVGMGALYIIARIAGLGASSITITVGDYATKALVLAGLLNIISAVDAHSLANGRKVSH